MDRSSSRCAGTAARALYTLIAAASISCTDAGAGDPPETPEALGPSITSPPISNPSANTSTPSDSAVPASEAGAPSVVPTGPTGSALDTVDANGVRGTLVDMPFLAETSDGKKNLMQIDWEVPAGKEVYLCGRVTVSEDLYFSATYPVNPVGTHHTAMSVLDKPNAPDGVTLCDASEVGRRSVGGSGVGTSGGKLPAGFAMKAEGGSQLILNLHLFNTSAAPLKGRSGGLVETVLSSQVTTLVDGFTAGPIKLTVPPGPSVQTGVCTVEHDYTILRILPHMHEMGRYMKVVAKRALGDEIVLYDGGYDFTHQYTYPIDPPLKLATGDRIEVACTYDNTTGEELHFGESSKDEMCLAGILRFPAGGKAQCAY
jgi:hypothetical protein